MPTANGVPGEPRCEYVRPWQGSTSGYAANAGEWGKGERGGGGNIGVGWGDGSEAGGRKKGRSMDVAEGKESGKSAQLLSEESASAE